MIVRLLLPALALACSIAHAEPFVVGVTPSDDPALAAPTPRDSILTVAQVEAMVRRAVEHAGGLAGVVPENARLVVLKPNVVTAQASGTGVITDTRVVRAVALLIHEVAPQARILIAEGSGGWVLPAMADCVDVGNAEVVDGFEAAGHRATAAELRERGLDIECFDLNFDRAVALKPPTGGLSMDEYELAATILEADAWINLPVAKTHGTKITCCQKNQFGLFPGTVYGWNKSRGTENHRGIPHAPRMIDETFIDLLSLTEPDFHVVDMIAGAEGGAFSGAPKRSNLIVAGRDAIATDLVVARLMGFNPDDFEYAPLGRLHGIGPGSIDRVTVRGGRLEDLASRFKKASMDYTSEWAEHAGFGMGPRRWTLLGPLPRDHVFEVDALCRLAPTPGEDGWSEIVRFGDDRIDLDKLFDDPTHCAVYAFTRFTMAHSDSVRLWIGSDEDLQVWIDGTMVHDFEGRRRHVLGGVRDPAYIEAGQHSLLVRAGQTRGRFDFSINICEPIDDPLYAGNRYPGVRYYVTHPGEQEAPARGVAAEHVREDWMPEPTFLSTLPPFDPVAAAAGLPGSLSVAVDWRPRSVALVEVATSVAGVDNALLDSATAAFVSALPIEFGFDYIGGWFPRDPIPPGRILGWFGLGYDVRTGLRFRESVKTVRGWLGAGRVPIVGFGRDYFAVAGVRPTAEGVQLHLVGATSAGADTSYWSDMNGDWWAQFPGNVWQNCPVIVVDAAGAAALADTTLTDSVAALVLDIGTRPTLEGERKPWGEDPVPGGLAAWDAWIIAWGRFPLTRAWLEEDTRMRRDLPDLPNDWALGSVVTGRRDMAGYFAAAALRLAGGHREPYLQRAANGFATVADRLEKITTAVSWRSSGDWSDEELALLEALPATLDLWIDARAAEREALQALAEMLGARPLPPIHPDPLRHRDRGLRLATWHADLSRGVYDVTLGADGIDTEVLFGRQPEGETSQVLAAVRREAGWQVAIEAIVGQGRYQVLEQPGPDNDWTARLRLDDHGSWQSGTDLVVWAVPGG